MAEKIISIKIQTDAQTKQLTQFSSEVQRLTKHRKTLTKAVKAGKITQEQANKARAQLNVRLKANRNALRDVEAAILKQNSALRKNSGFVAGVRKGVGQFAKSAVGMVAGFAAITAVVGDAFGAIKDFDQAQANLASILGKNKKEISELTASAKKLGATTAFTATQVASLQTEFAKLGFTEKQILNATEATLDLAAATGTELAEAASVVGNTLGGFGLEAEETQRVVDVMAKSFSSSALDMEKFRESMKLAAPVAKAVGVSVEETTALLGTLASAGISGSSAGTALRKTFIELGAAGLTVEEALEKVNSSQDRLGAATDLVGKKAASAFLVLADGTKKTDQLERTLNRAGGAAKRMAETQLDTLSGSAKLLGSAWEGFILGLDSGDGIISKLARGAMQNLATVLGILTSETDEATNRFNDQQKTVQHLESEITPLIDRHEELTTKTTLTKDEQEELEGIIQDVAVAIPLAVTEFDKYGQAMGISTDAAKAFIEQQKLILQIDAKDAIIEQEDAITELNRQMLILTDGVKNLDGEWVRITKTFSKTGRAQEVVLKLSAEELAIIQRKREEIQKEIDAREAKIANLKGEKSELEKVKDAQEAASAAAKAAAEEDAKANGILIQLQNRLKELNDIKDRLNETDREGFIVANEEIKLIQEKIRELNNLSRALESGRIKELEIREARIKDREDERKLAGRDVTDETVKRIEQEGEEAQRVREINADAQRQLALDTAQAISDGTFTILQERNRRELAEFDKKALTERMALSAEAKVRLKDASLNDEQRAVLAEKYARRQADLERRQDQQREILERKAFQRQKKLQIAQAIANGALAITGILATPSPDFTGITQGLRIAAAVATTGIQVATIAAQQFADGGIVQGGNGVIQHGGNIATQPNGDNVLATVRTGEVILNEQQQAMLGGAPTFRAIGVPGFANGGVVPSFSRPNVGEQVQAISGITSASVAEMIDSRLESIPVVVSEQAISGTQRNVSVNEQLGDF